MVHARHAARFQLDHLKAVITEALLNASLETGLDLALIQQGEALPPYPDEHEAFVEVLVSSVREYLDDTILDAGREESPLGSPRKRDGTYPLG